MLTEEQVIEAYSIVFGLTHSPGFKVAEMRDLLFDEGYVFLERPKEKWQGPLKEYLISINFPLSNLKMNPWLNFNN